MTTRRLSRIAILAALAIALRFAFAQFPNVKPITALFFVLVGLMGLTDSLLVMAVTMLGSSLLFGFGIVVFWQIASFAFLQLCWKGYLALHKHWNLPFATVFESCLAGLLALLYGFLISIPMAVQFQTSLIVYWINGLAFDLAHAVSTALFYPIVSLIVRRVFPNETETHRL